MVGVPVPARLREEVTAVHRHRVAADDRPHARTLDDEAEGVLGVAVLGGVLAGHEVLDGRPQRRRGEGPAAEGGVGQRDGPALTAPADRHQAAGPVRKLPQPLPAPQVRHGTRARVGRHQVADLGPQRDEQFLFEAPVKLFERRGDLGLPLRGDSLEPDRGTRGGVLGYGGLSHGISVRRVW